MKGKMITPSFNLVGLDHVVIRTRNVTEMMFFYCDVLGCKLAKHNKPLGLYHLSAGTSMIDLITLDGKLGSMGGAGPGIEGKNVDHIALKISPFNAEIIKDYLRSHGINPGDVVIRFGAEGNGPSIYITDPEGNGVELKGV